MMKSIRMKLVFWICVLFILIGALIYLPLSSILPKIVTAQILNRDVEIAKHVSNEAKGLLLFGDDIALSLLLHENLERLEDAQYLFIQSRDGGIISHTFPKGFPRGLLSFGIGPGDSYRVREFLSHGRKIYDIAVPILKGEIGALHLGVSMESGKKEIAAITKINYYVAGVILIGLGIGVFVFLTIGFLFSSKIIKLKKFANNVGKGDFKSRVDINSKDEIGDLAFAFNEMALRLKEKIQEIKRLNAVEERNKIALDLHDGCAQDAANIIKRVELCQKLFKIDPLKALQELEGLKEIAKDSLDWTRRMISNLKTPEDVNFSLPERLKDYIIDYRKRNDIDVKLDMPDSTDNILLDKKKPIFYIITEALANVRKHSHAKNVELHLYADKGNSLAISIKDDGRGFDTGRAGLHASDQERWGLIGMRQRTESLGGVFSIKSVPGQGTKIYVNIPLKGL